MTGDYHFLVQQTHSTRILNHEVLDDDYEKRKVVSTDRIELLDGQMVKNVENDGYNYLDILEAEKINIGVVKHIF